MSEPTSNDVRQMVRVLWAIFLALCFIAGVLLVGCEGMAPGEEHQASPPGGSAVERVNLVDTGERMNEAVLFTIRESASDGSMVAGGFAHVADVTTESGVTMRFFRARSYPDELVVTDWQGGRNRPVILD